MPDCLFCKIITGELPAEKVYEDEDTFAFLDIHPINVGHTLVVPKQHVENIYDIPSKKFGALMEIVHKLAPSIKNAVSADGVNIGMNNERAAGQIIFHAHVHIIPRYISDGFEHWHGSETSPADIRNAAERIRTSVSK